LSDTLNIGMEFFIEEGLDLFLIIKWMQFVQEPQVFVFLFGSF
jgi:hypothetical protein